ncbi:hypothetical protein RclHR1_01920003 [Rhizophagus clarus]|uniref:Uncharacterized protein n=1 Tax=Rhizophagus clarus TaxID=94130 RepID=A0A2Z6R188_9GLOM|nr:hypothetical protein RclHR1_01920003 [Rhizophagus clarus]GES84035.1 hypothetical protein RCL_jg19569.t1 [Rhizophagus clarus]
MEDNMIDNKNKPNFANFFHFKDFDAEKSVTSWFISSKTLLIIRGIIALYTWIILIGQFIDTVIYGGTDYFFVYFTNLGFVGLTAYFTTAFYHSYRYVTKNNKPVSFQYQPDILNWLFWLLYHTIVHYSTIIMLAYWIFLSKHFILEKPLPYRWWLNVSMHGSNFLLTMIEIFLNRQIMVASFVILCLTIQIFYMFVVFINYALTSQWIYEFMDFTRGSISALWYIGLLIGFTIIFFIMYGVHLLRDSLGRRFDRHNDDYTNNDEPVSSISI